MHRLVVIGLLIVWGTTDATATGPARRFLTGDGRVSADFKKPPIELPGVFAPDTTVEVNGQVLRLPGEFHESRTLFYQDDEAGDYAMVMKHPRRGGGKKKEKDVIGAAMKRAKAYNVMSDETMEEIVVDENIDGVEVDEELNPLNKTRIPIKAQGMKLTQFEEQNVIKFYPGCWKGDIVPRELIIGIVADRSYALAFGEKTDLVLEEIQKIVTNSRLIMYVQLNVILTVGEVVIGGISSPTPLNETEVLMVRSSDTLLNPFRLYVNARQKTTTSRKASWHMLTNRWPSPGVVGMAYLGTLCAYEYNSGVTSRLSGDRTWYIWIHELGHSMGAFHSFENGMGRTGGIMDYGNYFYNGVVQFHPLKQPEMCQEFSASLTCPYFREAPLESKCGDKVLSASEQCECLDNSRSCKGCVGCKLTSNDTECSTGVFVLRPQGNQNTLSVDQSSLSEPGCCKDNRFVDAGDSTCASGGICEKGVCVNRCRRFGFGACTPRNSGCMLPCDFGGVCVDYLKSATGEMVSHVQDARCMGDGYCDDGFCVRPTPSPVVSPTMERTSKPSTSPPSTDSPTLETPSPSRRPTRRRRRRPPTRSPSLAPTETGVPTGSPSPITRKPTRRPSRRPTSFPTRKPSCCECPTASPTKNGTKGEYEYGYD